MSLPTIEKANLLEESSRKKSQLDDENVIEYYQHTADAGDANAQNVIGNIFYYGARGVAQDYSMARRYFYQAAAQGNAVSMAYLGQIYVDGLGVAQNNETALEYFRKASEMGNPAGIHGLGYMYFHGLGVKKDVQLALSYFKKAAAAGYAESMFFLGTLYQSTLLFPHYSH